MSRKNSFAESELVHLFSAQDSFFSESQWYEIEKSRLHFLKKGIPDNSKVVRDEVLSSWERSYQNGLDPASSWLKLKISDKEFQKTYRNYEYMIKLVMPLITMTDDIGIGDDYIIEFIGANGVSLLQIGNKNLHVHVDEKSIFNESTMGTNAHSLCMRHKRPFQLLGPEHYCEALHNIAAAAVPIIDEVNDTTASLVITRPLPAEPWSSETHRLLLHAMGLIVSIATAVITDLKYHQVYTHMMELEHEVEKLKPPLVKDADNDEKGEQKLSADSLHIEGISLRSAHGEKKWGKYQNVNKEESRSASSGGSQREIGDVATITFNDILGRSTLIRNAVELAKRFARTNENILLIGESGTGKEYFAQAIHNSSHPEGPFMSINCAAIPPRLIESELFGYESGTFTGAQRGGKAGKIELANGGTLFLDEIGDMPLELQATLLRVLENKRVMRLGGKVYKQVDFRVIAATNRDLIDMVRELHFREDLYYRLSTLSIELPALRKRPEDLDFFIRYYLDDFKCKSGVRREFNAEASNFLHSFSWPGNVRQLKNAILSSCYAAKDELICLDDMPHYLPFDNPIAESEDLSLRHLEEAAIKAALIRTDYNVAKAAEKLDISRATLYRKLKEYNLASNLHDIR